MIPESLRTRGVFFAYMFGPPRFVPREEASRVHGKVCDALGLDDLAFKYGITGAPEPAARGFSITMERTEGKGGYKVEVDNQSPASPIRLLMSYTWPPSLEEVKERLDLTADAVLQGIEGGWTRVMAEVRLRAQVNVRGNDAVKYLNERFVSPRPEWLDGLGQPLAFASARFEVDGLPSPSNSLENPRRELTVEVLREDRRCVYLELMTQWVQGHPGTPGATLDLEKIRAIDQEPSAYMEEAYDWLTERVQGLGV